MDQPGPALCVVNKESVGKVHLNSEWKTFAVSGHNLARWKMTPVQFVRPPSGFCLFLNRWISLRLSKSEPLARSRLTGKVKLHLSRLTLWDAKRDTLDTVAPVS